MEAVVERARTVPWKLQQRKSRTRATTPSNGRGGRSAPKGELGPWHVCPSQVEEQIALVRDVAACALAWGRTKLNPGQRLWGMLCAEHSPGTARLKPGGAQGSRSGCHVQY